MYLFINAFIYVFTPLVRPTLLVTDTHTSTHLGTRVSSGGKLSMANAFSQPANREIIYNLCIRKSTQMLNNNNSIYKLTNFSIFILSENIPTGHQTID